MKQESEAVWETVCTRALKEESEAVWEVTVSAGHLVLESDHHLPKPKNTTLSEQGRVFMYVPFSTLSALDCPLFKDSAENSPSFSTNFHQHELAKYDIMSCANVFLREIMT